MRMTSVELQPEHLREEALHLTARHQRRVRAVVQGIPADPAFDPKRLIGAELGTDLVKSRPS